MKKLIKVIDKETANSLETEGFKYMTEYLDNKEVYVFLESDNLFKILSDKKRFSKRHWFLDYTLKF